MINEWKSLIRSVPILHPFDFISLEIQPVYFLYNNFASQFQW